VQPTITEASPLKDPSKPSTISSSGDIVMSAAHCSHDPDGSHDICELTHWLQRFVRNSASGVRRTAE